MNRNQTMSFTACLKVTAHKTQARVKQTSAAQLETVLTITG